MRRGLRGLAAFGVACALGVGVGVGVGVSAIGASAAPALSAPDCLPATLDSSARLPGTPLLVTPAPGGLDAMAQTQLSFLGAPASQISLLLVRGSVSGRHAGRLQAYSQGDGPHPPPRH